MAFAHIDSTNMFRKIGALALTTALSLLIACSLMLKLKVEDYGNTRRLPAEAPVIVIATIISNTQIGHEVLWHSKNDTPSYSETTHSYERRAYPLQLFKVKVKIENMLRGQIEEPEPEIYYYTYVGPIGGVLGIGMHGFGGRWEIGDRQIFYVKKVGNVLRTCCDLNESCVTSVFSGAHPDFTFDTRKPPADSIVDVLLTRGKGSTDQGMVKAVLSRSAEYFSEPYAIRKWKEIAEHDESSLVRDAACSQLTKEELPCPAYKGNSVSDNRTNQSGKSL